MRPKRFRVETVKIAQVRFYETLYVIKDDRNETIFTGDEELAKRIMKALGKPRKLAKR